MSNQAEIEAIRKRLLSLTRDQMASVLWVFFGALQDGMTESDIASLNFAITHAEESK